MPPRSRPSNESLALRYQHGDAAAAELLLTQNGGLVYREAHRLRHRAGSLDLADLVQEGKLGLLYAASRFDPKRGARFSTCATPWIRQAIRRAVTHGGSIIRRPQHLEERFVADREGQPLPAVVASLAEPYGPGSELWEERIPSDMNLEAEVLLSIWTRDLLAALPARERRVLEARFGFSRPDPPTLRALGEELNLTAESVRQIEKKAVQHLRKLAAEG